VQADSTARTAKATPNRARLRTAPTLARVPGISHNDISSYDLPSSDSQEAYHIADLDRWLDPPLLVLTSLAGGPKHGYAITQDVAENLGVQLSPGTLYGVIARLEERGYITALPADDRRRPYRITAAGATELRAQTVRLRAVADLASKRARLISRPAASS
jgi:DNA-binding PadR family transcriptional regulator